MPRSAAETKKRILAAAVAEFSRHGIDGARIDRIADTAQANKRAIYEYFGDKAALFGIVLADQLDRLAAAVELRPDAIGEFVGELFDYCADHPELVRLVQWEALSLKPREAPRHAERSASYQAKIAALAQAQRDGHLDSALDPRRVLLLLIGMAEWTLYAPQLGDMILGADPDTPHNRAEHRAFLVAVAQRLLRPGT
ncbi:TetR family transcriptional regulator [Streptomonospora nanhaiensis]|uniref:AcrR family transcriptional regulator n=1 Tax=Streptomonospora nanhaiensis TaxID=1323731 RepID=A0A853BRM2_9ACTN|nr:TetR family transcriptional regulator [Streptomonospora nanhaiensis]MBV2362192.1 TetR family transcriptional regulator [Streptomonospora nanhaiensis]MBX9388160.1 TetR family transcriptional regulator [Streptomonospora nanhaiensis]NYI97356.1 AcrR family transcriptional regulator [Streptomonospora nanhaiensis]